jgi:hypothetical protein
MENFCRTGIKSGDPISWPLRSPNLTALLFTWNYVKQVVLRANVDDTDHMKGRIKRRGLDCFCRYHSSATTAEMPNEHVQSDMRTSLTTHVNFNVLHFHDSIANSYK